MDRTEQMKKLKRKGFSYGSISKLFGISRQRVHQIISGYICSRHRKQNGKYKWLDTLFKSIFERDNSICQKCGGKGTLIHHIDKDDLNNDIKNLICFCSDCHLDLYRPKEASKQTKKKLSEFAETRKRKNGKFI